MKKTAILLLTAALASPLPAKEGAAIDAETVPANGFSWFTFTP